MTRKEATSYIRARLGLVYISWRANEISQEDYDALIEVICEDRKKRK